MFTLRKRVTPRLYSRSARSASWSGHKQPRFASKSFVEKREKQRAVRLFKHQGTPILIGEHLRYCFKNYFLQVLTGIYVSPFFFLVFHIISAKGIANLLGVRTVDVLKILIALDVPPETSDDLLPPDLVDIVCVCALLFVIS